MIILAKFEEERKREGGNLLLDDTGKIMQTRETDAERRAAFSQEQRKTARQKKRRRKAQTSPVRECTEIEQKAYEVTTNTPIAPDPSKPRSRTQSPIISRRRRSQPKRSRTREYVERQKPSRNEVGRNQGRNSKSLNISRSRSRTRTPRTTAQRTHRKDYPPRGASRNNERPKASSSRRPFKSDRTDSRARGHHLDSVQVHRNSRRSRERSRDRIPPRNQIRKRQADDRPHHSI